MTYSHWKGQVICVHQGLYVPWNIRLDFDYHAFHHHRTYCQCYSAIFTKSCQIGTPNFYCQWQFFKSIK